MRTILISLFMIAGFTGCAIEDRTPTRAAVDAFLASDDGRMMIQEALDHELSIRKGASGIGSYAPDPVMDVDHIVMDLEWIPTERKIQGTVTHTLTIRPRQLEALTFHAVGLDIESVRVNDSDVPQARVRQTAETVEIYGASPFRDDEEYDVAITYSRTNPVNGLFLSGPYGDYSEEERWHEAWTQGQAINHRHWLPLHDWPNDTATTEMFITVPKPIWALSNGELISTEDVDDTRHRFHWQMEQAYVTYLITLAAAEWSVTERRWRGIPVRYIGRPNEEEQVVATLERTEEMLDFFSDWTGVRYPYAQYSQVYVTDFTWGGMENITASTMSRRFLYDEATLDVMDADWLIAHELMHQWFGDYVTCTDWSHIWLNEGFATYSEALWEGRGSEDAYRASIRRIEDSYFRADASSRQPMVRNSYDHPMALFDHHAYDKGALVLNVVRGQLGDEEFRDAVQLYLERHAEGNVVTHDLIQAIQDATGRNLERLFDEFVFHEGYPIYRLAYETEPSEQGGDRVHISLEQVHEDGVHVFSVPVELIVAGNSQRRRVSLSPKSRSERLTLEFPEDVAYVALDPDGKLLKKVEWDGVPTDALVRQLRGEIRFAGGSALAAMDAARELAARGRNGTIADVETALNRVPELGLKVLFFEALTRFDMDRVAPTLTEIMSAEIESLLQTGRSARLAGDYLRVLARADYAAAMAQPLRRWLDNDAVPSGLRLRLLEALGQHGSGDADFERLAAAARTESYRDLTAIFAMNGLERLNDPRALEVALEHGAHGQSLDKRVVAISLLGQFGHKSEAAEKLLLDTMNEPHWNLQRRAITAAASIGSETLMAAIEDLAGQANTLSIVKRLADRVLSTGESDESTDRLQAQLHELAHRVAELEADRP